MIRAAKYLGVAPWELQRRGAYWLQWALVCENAENWSENEHHAHELAKMRNQR